MNQSIESYLKSGIEPWPDPIFGDGYRCSAYLKDGTFLPCVMLRMTEPMLELALRRFDEERHDKGIFRQGSTDGYRTIVRSFVAGGNRLNAFDIATVKPSRFAIPRSLLSQIEGETTMGWTGFVLEMADGHSFAYGTTFGAEFFGLPDSYEFSDISRVHNHSYVSPSGEVRSLTQGFSSQPAEYDASSVLRERPYFVCHFDAV